MNGNIELLEVVQIAAPFLAAGMATFWGGLAYRRNKKVDRVEAFLEEKRRVYHEFLKLAGEAANSFHYDSKSKQIRVCEASLAKVSNEVGVLNLYGSDEVIEAGMEFVSFLLAAEHNDGEELNRPTVTVREIGEVMRKDLLQDAFDKARN